MTAMNKDRVEGNVKQLTGKIKETWGRLTDDDIALYNGQRDQFLGRVQETYGIAKGEAEEQLRQFEKASPRNSDDRAA